MKNSNFVAKVELKETYCVMEFDLPQSDDDNNQDSGQDANSYLPW